MSKTLKNVEDQMAQVLTDHGWVFVERDSTLATYILRDSQKARLRFNKKFFAVDSEKEEFNVLKPIRHLEKHLSEMHVLSQ